MILFDNSALYIVYSEELVHTRSLILFSSSVYMSVKQYEASHFASAASHLQFYNEIRNLNLNLSFNAYSLIFSVIFTILTLTLRYCRLLHHEEN